MVLHPKKVFEEKLTWSDRLAIRIASFTGNMSFVWLHVAVFFVWVIGNWLAGEKSWDPYPFNFMTFIVSLEAIFLSTFVLIAQNREARRNEIREQLDYEVDQRAESAIQEIKLMVTKMTADVEQLKKKK
ncbi:MAG: DUF1003 domain-containing protein [Candidatus Kerfeldbacteria bacterium]|nr:DUF1003 domain-containing protein [Candidatus Kerfeldbacteria bacterium]